jgi:hypothetical protein
VIKEIKQVYINVIFIFIFCVPVCDCNRSFVLAKGYFELLAEDKLCQLLAPTKFVTDHSIARRLAQALKQAF